MANLGYLQLTRECAQHCRFCSNPPSGEELTAAEMAFHVDDLADRGYDGIILTGGEPTLAPLLLPAIARSRERGLFVRLITNGQRLSELAFFTELAQAGLSHVHLSLHSCHRPVHDYLTQTDGAWDRLTVALAHAGTLGVTADINTVINAVNSDHLDETVRFVCETFPFVRHFVWNNMDPNMNRAERNPDTIPRLREFEGSLHRAMAYLHRTGRTFRAERVPLCAMSGFPWASTETRKIVKEEERCIRFLDAKGFVLQRQFLHGKSEACDTCLWDPICAGLYSMGYHYDAAELAPVFADPLAVAAAVLGHAPAPELAQRLLARRGLRSDEQPDDHGLRAPGGSSLPPGTVERVPTRPGPGDAGTRASAAVVRRLPVLGAR